MYLAERMIGVVTYASVVTIMTYLIYKSPKEKTKKYFILYNIILFIMAFFYIPTTTADLTRLIEKMDYYSKIELLKLPNILFNNIAPMHVIYFYLIGKIGINELLPAITSFIFFGNVFYIAYKSSKHFKLDNKSVAISLLFFMSMGKFLEVISNIRSPLAFSIIAVCCYNEIIENKSFIKNLILYLIAALMHPAAVVLIIIRMLFFLLQKEKIVIKKIFNIIILLFLALLVKKYAGNYLNYAFEKAMVYINGEIYNYTWEYLISWIYIIFSTYTLICGKKYLTDNVESCNMRKFNIYINLIIILFSFEYSIFSRFQAFSSILFIPTLGIILNNIKKERTEKNKRFIVIFTIIMIIIFFITLTRGNLSGYKYLLFN